MFTVCKWVFTYTTFYQSYHLYTQKERADFEQFPSKASRQISATFQPICFRTQFETCLCFESFPNSEFARLSHLGPAVRMKLKMKIFVFVTIILLGGFYFLLCYFNFFCLKSMSNYQDTLNRLQNIRRRNYALAIEAFQFHSSSPSACGIHDIHMDNSLNLLYVFKL